MTFEDLCGIHMFSGVELTEEFRKDLFFGEGSVSVCLFTLDGVTYKAVENPDDGYRSWCESLETSDAKPKYSFPGIQVVCSMMPNDMYENNDVLVIKDAVNHQVVLEVGTKNCDDWYPYCHFEYHPENMSVNQNKEPKGNNPYWDRVTAIAQRQREKGLNKYGMKLEENDWPIEKRLEYLEEELVDGLMYIEWIKESFKNGLSDSEEENHENQT